jgi:hypothetical protein
VHARLLSALTAHYRIKVDIPPRFEPQSLESDFLFAGFGECFDSFFAFGLFALAQKSGYFEPELIAIFEPVVQEEARHILFFIRWGRVWRLRRERRARETSAPHRRRPRTAGANGIPTH